MTSLPNPFLDEQRAYCRLFYQLELTRTSLRRYRSFDRASHAALLKSRYSIRLTNIHRLTAR